MGYRQLCIEERCEIARLRGKGSSVREIAAALDRAASTVARELKRNTLRTGGYQASPAQEQARARRWTGARLERDEGLRERVLAGLKWGCSPEQVANELAGEEGRTVTSDESIYRFVYAQMARHKDYSWRHYLPRGKWKRGKRGRKGGSSASFIPLRRPVSERPSEAADRRTFGHWEADTMQFGRSGEVVLALHERCSRLLLLGRMPSKEAGPMAESIAGMLGPLPPEFRKTVTFDNGTEFTRHYELHRLGIETFFCDTYSPWQKGGVENAIGRLRRFLPRGTKLSEVSEERFAAVVLAYNNTPRKCLGYRTALGVVEEQVLHFKCGFTFPPARE